MIVRLKFRMSRTFKPIEVLALIAFAMGLAVVDTFARSGRSTCPQCELDMMQRSAADDHAPPTAPSAFVVDDEFTNDRSP